MLVRAPTCSARERLERIVERNAPVIKLALPAAIAALLFFSGSALTDQAQAQDRGYDNYYYQYGGTAPILGEGGAHWGGQCWVETWGGGTSYFGYWKPCAPAAPARTARH
jgi:hypothetical protein